MDTKKFILISGVGIVSALIVALTGYTVRNVVKDILKSDDLFV